MNASLEFNGRPVTFNAKAGLATADTGEPLVSGEILTVCAWCDPAKVLTEKLKAAGYQTSHGICQKCADGLEMPDVP